MRIHMSYEHKLKFGEIFQTVITLLFLDFRDSIQSKILFNTTFAIILCNVVWKITNIFIRRVLCGLFSYSGFQTRLSHDMTAHVRWQFSMAVLCSDFPNIFFFSRLFSLSWVSVFFWELFLIFLRSKYDITWTNYNEITLNTQLHNATRLRTTYIDQQD